MNLVWWCIQLTLIELYWIILSVCMYVDQIVIIFGRKIHGFFLLCSYRYVPLQVLLRDFFYLTVFIPRTMRNNRIHTPFKLARDWKVGDFLGKLWNNIILRINLLWSSFIIYTMNSKTYVYVFYIVIGRIFRVCIYYV